MLTEQEVRNASRNSRSLLFSAGVTVGTMSAIERPLVLLSDEIAVFEVRV
jgi:hypothetical protein